VLSRSGDNRAGVDRRNFGPTVPRQSVVYDPTKMVNHQRVSNSTLSSSNVPVWSIITITSAAILGCVLVAGIARICLYRYRQLGRSDIYSVPLNSFVRGSSTVDTNRICRSVGFFDSPAYEVEISIVCTVLLLSSCDSPAYEVEIDIVSTVLLLPSCDSPAYEVEIDTVSTVLLPHTKLLTGTL